MVASLGVVGAGPAAAGAAYALVEAGVEVSVFEASPSVGGRAATRHRAGCTYDIGANYLSPDDAGRIEAVVEDLDTTELVDIELPVWTFDADGEIGPGDPDRTERHRWSYRTGLAEFVRRALDRSGAVVTTDTRIASMAHRDGEWRLVAAGGQIGTFDAVLLTPPAPVTAGLLGRPATGSPVSEAQRAAKAVTYRPVYSLALHYPFSIERPYYALVNVDREHVIGWVSREECKPGHVPDGETLLIAQLSPTWSAENAEPPESVAPEVARRVAELLGDTRLAIPDWADGVRWSHALPDGGADGKPLAAMEDAGLYFAGDWVAGRGRVGAAFLSGMVTGRRIAVR